MRFNTTEILDVLDNAVEVGAFPMPNNAYYYYANMRMNIFRGADEWLWIFELLRFNCGMRAFYHEVVAMGNMIPGNLFYLFDDSQSLRTFEAVPGQDFTDEDGKWILDPYNFQMSIKGEFHTFHLSSDDYASAGIDVNSQMPWPARIIRYLHHHFGKSLYATDAELLSICGRLNSDLHDTVPFFL